MRESPRHARPARCFPGLGTQPSWRQNLAHSSGYDVSDIAFARQRKLSQQLPRRLFWGGESPFATMGALAIFAAQILPPTYSTSSRHGGQAKADSAAPLARFFASGASHRDAAKIL